MLGRTNTGGGGASLNYKVVGGTSQPLSASENTIWVNTDTEITSHVFSVTQPSSPVAGMVWFQTGESSGAAMNVLKKNTLWVYPTMCYQYVSGAWVDKIAKTYQNGAWVDWTIYIYWLKNGNLTGNLASTYNASVVNGLISINVSAYNNACFVIDEPYDLTGAKKLCVKASVESLNSQFPPTFGIKTSATIDQAWASRGFATETQITATNPDFVTYTLELNKAFSGNHYFGYSGIAKITISEIWIEK